MTNGSVDSICTPLKEAIKASRPGAYPASYNSDSSLPRSKVIIIPMTKSPTDNGLPSCHELVSNKSAGYVQVTFTFEVTPSPTGMKVCDAASQSPQASAGTETSGANSR